MTSRTEKNKEKQEEIIEEERRETRKKIVILWLKITFALIFGFFSFYFYTEYISTKQIITKEQRINNKKIPDSFNGIKIIQFSDLYYGSTIGEEEIDNLIKEINMRKPDIVIFTGNIISTNEKLNTKEKEKLIKKLDSINANIGKYAVTGKNDDKDIFTTIMNQSNFTILDNQYDLVYSSDNNPILLVGLSSLVKKERNIENAYKYFKEETHNGDIYTISIMSETDDIDEILASYKTDLILAGNSLNGEIRFPLIGGVIKQEGSDIYKNPYYRVNDTDIYVSSGIGTITSGVRLFNHPSINLFRLTNKD